MLSIFTKHYFYDNSFYTDKQNILVRLWVESVSVMPYLCLLVTFGFLQHHGICKTLLLEHGIIFLEHHEVCKEQGIIDSPFQDEEP